MVRDALEGHAPATCELIEAIYQQHPWRDHFDRMLDKGAQIRSFDQLDGRAEVRIGWPGANFVPLLRLSRRPPGGQG